MPPTFAPHPSPPSFSHPPAPQERTSFASGTSVIATHLDIQLKVDFDRQVLEGSCTLDCLVQGDTPKDGTALTLVLDQKNMDIHSATLVSVEKPSGGIASCSEILDFTVKAPNPKALDFGAPLNISLPGAVGKGDKIKVEIKYATASGAGCSAMQWLEPEQTNGKKHPYLFTQCQAIHCRAMVPCQDAPAVKCTYTAALEVPAGLTAVMSAVPVELDEEGEEGKAGKGEEGGAAATTRTFRFVQSVPIPSYLIAICVGDLAKRDISDRCAIWSEPGMVDAGWEEFADTERFLVAAEQVCGPYVWGRYDLLLLPPSFPYGGMENPCLTFVTPTLLAGGTKANVSVVAHEIAHSWTGNLVTNRTWFV